MIVTVKESKLLWPLNSQVDEGIPASRLPSHMVNKRQKYLVYDDWVWKEVKESQFYWYESLANKTSYSTKVKDLNVSKYKQTLWDKIEDMLKITSYNVAKIKQDLLYESESMIITSNSRKQILSAYYNLTTNKQNFSIDQRSRKSLFRSSRCIID